MIGLCVMRKWNKEIKDIVISLFREYPPQPKEIIRHPENSPYKTVTQTEEAPFSAVFSLIEVMVHSPLPSHCKCVQEEDVLEQLVKYLQDGRYMVKNTAARVLGKVQPRSAEQREYYYCAPQPNKNAIEKKKNKKGTVAEKM